MVQMAKWVIIAIVIIVILGFGGLSFFGGSSQGKGCTPEAAEKIAAASDEVAVIATITHIDNEFTPNCLQISQGTIVTWVNNGEKDIQIGADPHPVHSGNKEVSDGEYVLTVGSGEEATVTVERIGKSAYHDHFNPSAGGAIIVK